MSASETAKTPFQSLCAGKTCNSCQPAPTIVWSELSDRDNASRHNASRHSASRQKDCTCVRNIGNELALAAWYNTIEPKSLVLVDSCFVPQTRSSTCPAPNSMTASARSNATHDPERRLQPFSDASKIPARRLQNLRNANATFLLRKGGFDHSPTSLGRLASVDPFGPGVPLAEASRIALDQISKLVSLADPKHVDKDDTQPYLSDHYISLIDLQLRGQNKVQKSESYRSYHSPLDQGLYLLEPSEWLQAKRNAMEKANINPEDLCPSVSSLLVEGTAEDVLTECMEGRGTSVTHLL